MATKKAPASKAPGTFEHQMDEESNAIIYQGVSLSHLVSIFKMDIRKVKARIAELQPIGKRANFPIYSLKDAAAYLVEPPYPIEEWIQKMNHADLPMLLRKEYWAGMRSRQIYQIAAGDLWPTDRVVDVVSEMLKTVSMSLRLASDRVDREVGLTHTQRELVIRLMDEALANAHAAVEKQLKDRKPVDGAGPETDSDEDDEL
jgi:hypothetical protein